MGFDLGSFLGSIIAGTGLGIGRSGMHAPTPEQQGVNLVKEAQAAGLSPLALAGGPQYSGLGASTGDPGVAGQMLGRAFQANNPAAERMDALREQNLALENMRLSNDVVAGQLRNSQQRVTFGAHTPPPKPWTPPQISLDDVWGSLFRGHLAPKAGLQDILRPSGSVYSIPSAVVQQGLWSPLPGAAANPQAISDVIRANSANIPPDVARMSGAPWYSFPFLSGTAAGWSDAAKEGRTDPSIYGNPLW